MKTIELTEKELNDLYITLNQLRIISREKGREYEEKENFKLANKIYEMCDKVSELEELIRKAI